MQFWNIYNENPIMKITDNNIVIVSQFIHTIISFLNLFYIEQFRIL